jgi:hypothetical protein
MQAAYPTQVEPDFVHRRALQGGDRPCLATDTEGNKARPASRNPLFVFQYQPVSTGKKFFLLASLELYA